MRSPCARGSPGPSRTPRRRGRAAPERRDCSRRVRDVEEPLRGGDARRSAADGVGDEVAGDEVERRHRRIARQRSRAGRRRGASACCGRRCAGVTAPLVVVGDHRGDAHDAPREGRELVLDELLGRPLRALVVVREAGRRRERLLDRTRRCRPRRVERADRSERARARAARREAQELRAFRRRSRVARSRASTLKRMTAAAWTIADGRRAGSIAAKGSSSPRSPWRRGPRRRPPSRPSSARAGPAPGPDRRPARDSSLEPRPGRAPRAGGARPPRAAGARCARRGSRPRR